MSLPIDRRAFMQRAAGASAALSISLAGPLTRQGPRRQRPREGGRHRHRAPGRLQPEGVPAPRRGDRRRVRRLRAEPREGQGGGGRGRRGLHRLPAAARRQDDRPRRSTRPPTTGTPCPRSWPARRARTSSSRSRSRWRSRRARPWSPPRASTSGSSRWASGSARTPTSSRRRRSSARASSARSRSCAPGTTATRPRPASGTRRTPTRPPASTGTCGSGPAPKVPFNANRFGVRRPLVHLPLLLGLLERHARGLGRAPRRHRAVGARRAGAAGDHRASARSTR